MENVTIHAQGIGCRDLLQEQPGHVAPGDEGERSELAHRNPRDIRGREFVSNRELRPTIGHEIDFENFTTANI